MTHDEITELWNKSNQQIYVFAKLVAAKEREACAKVCDVNVLGDEYTTALINSYADTIRARGQQ